MSLFCFSIINSSHMLFYKCSTSISLSSLSSSSSTTSASIVMWIDVPSDSNCKIVSPYLFGLGLAP